MKIFLCPLSVAIESSVHKLHKFTLASISVKRSDLTLSMEKYLTPSKVDEYSRNTKMDIPLRIRNILFCCQWLQAFPGIRRRNGVKLLYQANEVEAWISPFFL